MVTADEVDFEAFVTARFAELVAVAAVTTGDPVAAAAVAATGLASVADRWAELTAAGNPASAARSTVLTGSLNAPRSTAHAVTTDHLTLDDGHDGEGSATRSALAAVILTAPATARAALAVAHFWDETPALVAACARVDTDAVVAELDALTQALASAHAAALGRQRRRARLGPAGRARRHPRAPCRHRTGGRPGGPGRNRPHPGTPGGGAPARAPCSPPSPSLWRPLPLPPWRGPTRCRSAAVPTLAPDAQQWSAITSWAPRGRLVGDPAVTALVAAEARDPGARLLFAGPVGDTTVVLMSGTQPQARPAVALDPGVVPGPDIAPLHLSLWTAPARRGPAALAPTPIKGDDSARTSDVVALSIDQDAAGAPPVVLVLTRPTVTEGFAVTGARPDPDGRIRPLVQSLALTGGVAMFTQNPGYPTKVAVAGFTGPPAGVVTDGDLLPRRGSADDLATAQRTLLAGIAGYPVGALDTPSALDAVVDLPNPEAGILGADPGDVHVTVVSTVTADGGWVRTSRLSTSSEDLQVGNHRAPGRGPRRRPLTRPAAGRGRAPAHVRRARPRRRHRPAHHHRRPAARHRHRQGRSGRPFVHQGPDHRHVPAAPARSGRTHRLRRCPTDRRGAARLMRSPHLLRGVRRHATHRREGSGEPTAGSH